jgi:amino acid adenylation domain-containing protein
MRAVLSTIGTNGDFQPMLALAAELLRAGHQPVLALSPNFEERARDNGIEFVQLGPTMPLEKIRSIISAQIGNQKPAEQVRYFLEATLPHLPAMCQTLRETCGNADVLIGSPYQLACRIVHETTAIPYVSLHLSQFADLGGGEMREVSASLINPYRAEQGLPSLQDPLGVDGNSNQLAIYAVSRYFLQRPSKWPDHYKVVGFFFHDENDWQPERELADFCQSGERPVVVSFGSIVHSNPTAITDLVLDAARQAECRMIIQRGWGGLGKEALPINVHVTGFAPHAWLFPRAALVVHHGGAGTTASALRAGVPAVVVPHTLDQPIWAEFARAQGCVRNVIPFTHLNANRLAAAIRSALASPQLSLSAAAFGAKISTETGVQTARELIEEFVASCQRPVEISGEQKSAKIEQTRIPLVVAPRHQELPLSYAQQRLWFADQLEQGSTAYNMPFLWRFEGELHALALQQAINHMVQRHEILRTTFPVLNGRPTQKIAAEMELALEEIDLQNLPPANREDEVRRIANMETTRQFDLVTGPLWSMKWLRLGATTHVLVGNLHHIVSDGWSQSLMSEEISQLYEAYVRNEAATLPQLVIQYADYAVWQRELFSSKTIEHQMDYWRKQLAGLSALELPTDYPRPVLKSYRGGSEKLLLSNELTDKLKALGRSEGATFFMVILAAFQILLSKYAGQEDISVGTPIAGRTRKELERLIGCFINMLALRTNLGGNVNFKESIHRARKASLEAYQHQDLPFEKIVQELQIERDITRTPLFQVMLVLQNTEMVRPQLYGLHYAGSGDLVESAPFDLTLEVIESRGTHCRLWYARDLYESGAAARMLNHFNWVLENMVTSPERKIAEFSLLTEAELHQVLVEWNNASHAYSSEYCIHEVFEQQAAKQPSASALGYEDQTLTYSELNCRANQLAHYLRKLGVGIETPVAVCMERRPEMMISLLGLLKAGGAYAPLDPVMPKERLRWMLNDLDSPIVLTQTEIAARLNLSGQVVCVDNPRIQEELLLEPQTNIGPLAKVENAAYVIYTSGSTGKPKAVIATHGSLVNLAEFQKMFFGVTPQDRVLQFVAPTFDPAIGDCFTGWVSGAAVILGPDPRQTLGRELAQLIETQQITYTGITPSMLKSLPEEVEFKELRILLTGGSACSDELMARWSKGRKLFNVYGPTEATICAVSTELSIGDGPVSIGRPIANARVYVLDRNMNPVPVGMRGELYIGGVGLTRGYWKRPDLTADRFVPNTFSKSGGERLYRTGDIVRWRADEKLEFVGRVDEQIKIREQRIELGEIEAVLRGREDIQDALVIAREDKPGNMHLVAYVIPKETAGQGILPSELRTALREELPTYMVPAHFVVMSAFPINTSGKIDRRELPIPAEPTVGLGPVVTNAMSEIERKIAGVWSEVLQVEKVDVHDNFFDLGGDSFQSIRVQSELVKVLGREIKVLELFRFPTVRSLAEYLAQTSEHAVTNDHLKSASLNGGRERLKMQLAQRAAFKSRGTSATASIN